MEQGRCSASYGVRFPPTAAGVRPVGRRHYGRRLRVYGGIVLTKVSLLVVVSLAGLGLSQAAVRWVGLKETPEVVLGTALVGVALSAVPASIILIGLMSVFGEAVMPKLDAPQFDSSLLTM